MDIHKTDVNIIRQETLDLISALDNNTVNLNVSDLQESFKNLFTTSPTLFAFIIKNYSKTRNDKKEEEKFKQNLNLILNGVKDVQLGRVSHTEASGKVGTHLAHTYIPDFKNMR